MAHGDGDLSRDPAARLGVWKCYEAVPADYRLDQYAALFRGRNVWQEYAEATGALETDSERQARDYRNMVESWNTHCRERETHPALATPADVEAWSQKLLDGTDRKTSRTRTPLSAYQPYWVGLEKLYDWMQWHADMDRYPHRYTPVVMAAAEYPEGATGAIWDAKMSRMERARGHDTHGETTTTE